MSSNQAASAPGAKTYFEQQRQALIKDIAESFDRVLHNINQLNRSLEAVITLGNEFSSVEALWSQFENVMAKEPQEPQEAKEEAKAEPEREEREPAPEAEQDKDEAAE